ncbi:hypothetical protein Syun_020121 [Stephania yunnanensis]|uniref:RING-type domain-containing protein n=1 Tax=Stephania yunnanensis TaxID=152371 RepID=A0AAP0ID98_9MAGN
MAVQAQYPLNAFGPRTANNALDGFHNKLIQQYHDNSGGNLFAVCNKYVGGQQQFLNGGAVLSEPGSELTCDASGSRKRNRDAQILNLSVDHLHQPHQRLITSFENRLVDSAMASTSGRSGAASLSLNTPPLSQHLSSCLLQQSRETDAVIRYQNEKLRAFLEETRKRHCRSLLSVLERQVAIKLKEKQSELENATKRNADLQEKVRQMISENEIWFNVAKNNEAIVSSLRLSIEQVVQNATHQREMKEGFGESDGVVGGALADDAASCCNNGDNAEDKANDVVVAEQTLRRENHELKQRRLCKVCGGNDVCVLLLPCRHLCLCKDCEPRLEWCPICNTTKNATLQVFMS